MIGVKTLLPVIPEATFRGFRDDTGDPASLEVKTPRC